MIRSPGLSFVLHRHHERRPRFFLSFLRNHLATHIAALQWLGVVSVLSLAGNNVQLVSKTRLVQTSNAKRKSCLKRRTAAEQRSANTSTRSRKKLMLAVASRPPRPYIWYVGAPGGVTPLEARENFSALAELLSTNAVRRSRPRSANYSTIWLRLHLRLRLRLRTRPASQCSAASLS